MAVSRGHHYVPQSYLKSFADPNNKDQLVVFDRAGKRFCTETNNIAKQRDFNTVRGASPPDMVESYYSEIESDIAVALREIGETGEMSAKGLDYIIALMTMMHVRSPRKRALSGGFMGQVVRQFMSLTIRDEKTYKSTLARMRKDGQEIGDALSFDDMKRFIESDKYEVTVENEAHIDIELELLPEIERVLRRRSWCLMVAPKGSMYVSSDHPSGLFWTGNMRGPLGLATNNTEVLLPISPQHAVIGRFEDLPAKADVDFMTVAERNAQTIHNCSQQVYAASNDFLYKLRGQPLFDMRVGDEMVTDENFLRTPDSRA